MQMLRVLESGRVHDRGDRRDHRSGARPAEERDVPHDGHRRHRRPRPRRPQSRRAARRRRRARRRSRCRRSSRRSSSVDGSARRPDRGSTSGQDGRRRSEILTLDPATLDLPAEAVCRGCRRSTPRARSTMSASGSRRSFSAATRSARFCAPTLGPTLLYTARVSPRHCALDRRCRSGDAMGIRLGAGAVRDLGCDRRSTRCSTRRGVAWTSRRSSTSVLRTGRNRFRDDGLPPAAPDLQILKSAKDRQRDRPAERRARASSTSATACSPSSSTRR